MFEEQKYIKHKKGPATISITVAGSQGGGREINECYSETKKN
jgi:hypothetical protein